MTQKEILELIKLVNKSELSEFRMKDKDFEVTIRTSKYQKKGDTHFIQGPTSAMPAPPSVAAPAATPSEAPATPEKAAPAAEEKKDSDANLVAIKSPIVGTFYRSSAPDKPPFKKVGDRVEKGEVVCIVEAMKLFNEIESEVSGTIVQVKVEDASPVEYDQVMFMVDPS